MIRDLIKWVVPGLATVLGGTTLCVAMTSADIASDLTARGSAAMAASGYDWAELSLDVRDLTLSGTTTDTAVLEAAIARLKAIDGFRTITSAVTLAPMASPYTLQASIDQDAARLSGGVPDETTRRRLLALAGLDDAELQLRSGMPDRRSWVAGAEFAIDKLKYFDQGQIVVSDLTVSVNGRARSERDYRDLLIVLRAGPPAGLAFGAVEITPALVEPYQWSASFDGKRIAVTGFVPDDAVAERLRTAAVSGIPIATGLALGSGEPAGFADLSRSLIEQLARLEYGSASITGGESTLTGAPPTLEIAQGIVDSLAPSGSIVTLEPPRIDDYWISATRQPGGVTVYDGYAPDEATREKFSLGEGADFTWLKLGRGAPERYQSGVDFGLAALDLMSEGRIALRDNVLTIIGVARSGADYETLLTTLADGAPQGIVLARAEVEAPRASSYNWSVSKDETGAIALSGLVPSPEAGASLIASAGESVTETMTYASGEPANFVSSAQTAIGLLQWLRNGTIAYDGLGWTVTGTANSAADKQALDADFLAQERASAGWSIAVAEPPPVIPEVSPYLWSATRTADGVTLMGHVPTASLKSFLAVHAGDAVVDTMEIGSGAPADFVAISTAALDAVLALEEGEVRFDGQQWSLNGTAESIEARDLLLASLATATDSATWSIAITAPEPQPLPVAEPEPALEPEPVVEPEPAPAIAEPAAPAVDPAYAFSARRKADGAVHLDGQLPAEPAKRYFGAISDGDIAAVTVAPGAPETFLPSAETGLRALLQLAEGELAFAQGAWSLEGVAPDEASRATIETALAADPGGANWTTAIEVTPPEPEPEAEATAAPEAPETPAAPAVAAATPQVPSEIAACAAPVAYFSARNAIFFASGSSTIAAESAAALDELAIDLAACPNAVVHIEGHTDSDGDATLNMALSVARAEAVVNALVARGVAFSRLYAVGYGESMPIADNATAQGKRINRRIVVTVKAQD